MSQGGRCRVCGYHYAPYGIWVVHDFVPICRLCAEKIHELYEAKYRR